MNDLDILARTLYGEAKANSVQDAEAIADVILNRCNLPNWPDTPAKVCQQPWQFSCWNTNDPNRERILNASGDWFNRCIEIAENATSSPDVTNRATHYCTPSVKNKTYWAKDKTPCYNTNGHLFFNDIDTPPPADATEALDQHRPLAKSRTIKGQQVVGAGTAGAALIEVGKQVTDAAQSVQSLVPYLDVAKWVFLGLILVGVGITVYARLDDRKKGRN
jgi:hypothetical protein